MERIRGIRRPDRHARARATSTPSIYIRSIEEIQPGDRVWLRCRVSSGEQDARGNNDNQEAELRAAVEARSGVVVDRTHYVGKANGDEHDAALYKAVNLAAKAGAILLAESTSRFVRHPDYNPKDPKPRMPGFEQLDSLRRVCGGVSLMTLSPPDATWQDERAHQTKRGQRQKGNKGGRPPRRKAGDKTLRRERLLPEVQRLVREGMSGHAIAKALGTSETNVRRWVRHFLHDGETN